MTFDELENCLADMREKLLAKGYPDPNATVYINTAGLGSTDIALFKREHELYRLLGSSYGRKCPYEAVTAAYEIIDGLPKLDATTAIKRDPADAVDRARAAGVDVAAVIGGEG